MQCGLACPVRYDFSCPLSVLLIQPRMNEHADKDKEFVLRADQASGLIAHQDYLILIAVNNAFLPTRLIYQSTMSHTQLRIYSCTCSC